MQASCRARAHEGTGQGNDRHPSMCITTPICSASRKRQLRLGEVRGLALECFLSAACSAASSCIACCRAAFASCSASCTASAARAYLSATADSLSASSASFSVRAAAMTCRRLKSHQVSSLRPWHRLGFRDCRYCMSMLSRGLQRCNKERGMHAHMGGRSRSAALCTSSGCLPGQKLGHCALSAASWSAAAVQPGA